jgi:hypothetical protein
MATRARRCFGLIGLCGALSCSLIVDTDGIDSGCGDRKKLCAGNCVSVDDPSYGCDSGCEPCRREDGIPGCESGACVYETCLYGWGCPNCTEQVLSNPEHCGSCDIACNPDQICSVGVCIPADTGGGGEGGGSP